MSRYIAIGLISGTSVDCVDAAAVEVSLDGKRVGLRLLNGISYPIPPCLKSKIFELFEDKPGSLHLLSLLNMSIGRLFADAAKTLVKKAGLDHRRIAVIGSHGQTVHHVATAEPCCGERIAGSLQIGEASIIARTTGIPVVSDFRTADMAAGGGGAPLVPVLDLVLFQDRQKSIAVQNIGGIGNVTWLPLQKSPVIAFDTGPGNMIVDMLMERLTAGKQCFDQDGRTGKKGRLRQEFLNSWMEHEYLAKRPPKTTGREEFGTAFLAAWCPTEFSPDIIRTAEEFTALSIARAYRDFLPRMPELVVVTGGGARNPNIMQALKTNLPGSEVLTGDEVGVSIDYKEAVAFALMALWRLLGRPNNVPAATGASCEVVMGKISHP